MGLGPGARKGVQVRILSRAPLLTGHSAIRGLGDPQALGDAVKLGKVPRNVADAVDKPSAAKPAHDIWTPEQLRAFLGAVREDRLYAMWLLFATTACAAAKSLASRGKMSIC